jgi:hypothetical protein
LSRDGKVAYQCQESKSEQVRTYLKEHLPSGSYKLIARGIWLTQDLSVLGFKSPQEFTQVCAGVRKGETLEQQNSATTPSEKRAEKPLPQPDRQQKVQQGKQKEEKKAKSIVSFDGPEHVLYVFKGALSCERRGHKVEGATGSMVTLAGRPVIINVNYCNNCRRYFLGQREYEHYRDIYGPVLGNFSFPESTQSGSGPVSLSKESQLMMCGYNVRESDGLTAKERQLILANMIDRKILSKPRIIEYLQFFISWREGNPNMKSACDKWREDLAFVRTYHMDTQRRFTIGAVRRSR